MILLTRILIDCVDGFESWAFDQQSTNSSPISQASHSELKEIFKMTNFRRTLNDVLQAKYPDIECCSHLTYVEYNLLMKETSRISFKVLFRFKR